MRRKLLAIGLVLVIFALCGCGALYNRSQEWKRIVASDMMYVMKDIEWLIGMDVPSSCHWDPWWEGIGQAR